MRPYSGRSVFVGGTIACTHAHVHVFLNAHFPAPALVNCHTVTAAPHAPSPHSYAPCLINVGVKSGVQLCACDHVIV